MKLLSENVPGNLHAAASWCNRLGISDVVAMEYGGGNYTVVVYKVTDKVYAAHEELRKKRMAQS